MTSDIADVLAVGARPTGLSLAAHLAAHGVRPRLIDRARDRVHESRALAIQPRTLEVLAGLGITPRLVELSNPAVHLRLHARGRERSVPLFDFDLADTAYPYLLLLSQAVTERVLADHLAGAGVEVERGVELVGLAAGHDAVTASVRDDDGREDRVSARYVVGCDGARSTVRTAAGIEFQGSSYPQTFVLADVEAAGLAPDAAHVFLADRGMLFIFPLRTPATWRLVVMRPPNDPTPPDAPVVLDDVQSLSDTYTGGAVRLYDPVWMTNFRLHHRAATHYRAGPIFLAGDAAHIHSPAGAQGMNTGIQDAVNLAWKSPTPCAGWQTRLSWTPTSSNARPSAGQCCGSPTAPSPLQHPRTRSSGSSERASHQRSSRSRSNPGPAAAMPSESSPSWPSTTATARCPLTDRTHPGAGQRPATVSPTPPSVATGNRPACTPSSLGPAGISWRAVPSTRGPATSWETVGRRYADLVTAHRLSADNRNGGLYDPDGLAMRRLGLPHDGTALYLVRPDGHIGYRSDEGNLTGVEKYLRHRVSRPAAEPTPRPGGHGDSAW